MLWRTHVLGGVTAGVLVASFTASTEPKAMLMSAGIAGFAALLPDLDSPHSKLGRIVLPASWATQKIIGHRGPLHSLLAAVIVALLAVTTIPFTHTMIWFYAIIAGYVSHLLLDALNPQGVPFFWPLPIRVRIPIARTGGIIERLLVMPGCFVVCIWMLYSAFF